MEYYAALDFGSNSTLLLLAHVGADGQLVEDMELFRTTRLGRKVDETGRLSVDGIQASLDAARDFLGQVKRECGEAPPLVAAATSAVRDAVNRDEFLEPCAELVGCAPVLLSGEDESETIFLGATSDLGSERPCLVLDIGGGSSEAAAGTREHCEIARSVNMGCVRLAERFGLLDATGSEAVAASRRHVRDVFRGVAGEMRDGLAAVRGREMARMSAAGGAGCWVSGVGCRGEEPARQTPVNARISDKSSDPADICVIVTGGTATTLAAYAQEMTDYDRSRVHGFDASERYVAEVVQELAGMTSAQRGELPGIPEGRAAVWPAGLIILSEMLQCFGQKRFRVSTRGLRFGLVRRLLRGQNR